MQMELDYLTDLPNRKSLYQYYLNQMQKLLLIHQIHYSYKYYKLFEKNCHHFFDVSFFFIIFDNFSGEWRVMSGKGEWDVENWEVFSGTSRFSSVFFGVERGA